MKYISTRGKSPAIGFCEILLSGLAPDGGLYMPETWPRLGAVAGSYAQITARVMREFAGTEIPQDELARIAEESYATFDDARVVPLTELKPGLFLLELFHGPTLAFKDIALQPIARLMERELEKRGRRAVVLGATSGDTGAAVVAAFANRKGTAVFILHPKGRISEMQRRQMTACGALNIRNIAIEGNFDDAQRIVKELFGDEAFSRKRNLAAINSLNFVRIAAQSVYFASNAARIGVPAIFAVPSGNFGNAFSGYCAAEMGVAISKIIVATNENDTLARVFESGRFEARRAAATVSPAMDIQKPSNFERLLFEASGRDGARVASAMGALAREGSFTLSEAELRSVRARFMAARAGEVETLAAMKRIHDKSGRLIDPHTAAGLAAVEKTGPHGAPVVALATAHPAKFPETVERATGARPPIPARLAAMMKAEERYVTLPPQTAAVRDYIEAEAERAWA